MGVNVIGRRGATHRRRRRRPCLDVVDVAGEEAGAVEVVEAVRLELELGEGLHAGEGARLQRLDVAVRQVQVRHVLRGKSRTDGFRSVLHVEVPIIKV